MPNRSASVGIGKYLMYQRLIDPSDVTSNTVMALDLEL